MKNLVDMIYLYDNALRLSLHMLSDKLTLIVHLIVVLKNVYNISNI